ncbi:MAG: hypothetical protein MZV63_12210 [Marinilabiliales bacterium]|nr:hypothetical protein [Marinilabiliales bacterium]
MARATTDGRERGIGLPDAGAGDHPRQSQAARAAAGIAALPAARGQPDAPPRGLPPAGRGRAGDAAAQPRRGGSGLQRARGRGRLLSAHRAGTSGDSPHRRTGPAGGRPGAAGPPAGVRARLPGGRHGRHDPQQPGLPPAALADLRKPVPLQVPGDLAPPDAADPVPRLAGRRAGADVHPGAPADPGGAGAAEHGGLRAGARDAPGGRKGRLPAHLPCGG